MVPSAFVGKDIYFIISTAASVGIVRSRYLSVCWCLVVVVGGETAVAVLS